MQTFFSPSNLDIQHPKFVIYFLNKKNKGFLLLELLIAISVLAIILAVGTQAVFVSLESGKVSSERDVAIGLASEALEAVRAVADERWKYFYTDVTNGLQYHPVISGGKWSLVEGSEFVTLNTTIYTRHIVVENVSRDSITRAIETSYVSANDDPSTQKVTVTVSWQDGDPFVISEYFFRWRNKVCNQTSWTIDGGLNDQVSCVGGATYESATNIITGASLQLTP